MLDVRRLTARELPLMCGVVEHMPKLLPFGQIEHRPAFWAMATVCIAASALLLPSGALAADGVCDFSRYRPVVRFGIVDPACVLVRVEPKYPPMGRNLNLSGEVVVRVVVNRAGKVVAACVDSGHPLLRLAAIEAARKWKFRKNFCLSRPQPRGYLETTIRFRFSMDTSRTPPN